VTSLDDLVDSEEVLARDLEDPGFRDIWERSSLARAVSIKVLKYRTERHLSQRALAAMLGVKQPQIARLESGEHTPSIDTLIRLSACLDTEFVLSIRPAVRESAFLMKGAGDQSTIVETGTLPNGTTVVAAVQ
jgi:ribosome-binding protein aMBF1 (putative translation factor)